MSEKEKKPNVYDMVVRCTIDDEEKNFYFDYIEDNTITLSSDVTTHPLVNGDVIADHMYINPANVSFGGSFSLLGNKKANAGYDFGSIDRLSNIQEMFERIMKEGITCELVKMGSNGDESRFKVRKDMALTNISWVEHQSSVDFNFSFTETLSAVVEDKPYELDVVDENQPVISDPLSLSVTEELINQNEVVQYVISILNDYELFEGNFLETVVNWCQCRRETYLAGAAVGAIAGAAIATTVLIGIKIIVGIFAGCAAIPGPGWVAAAVILAAAIVAGGIYVLIKQ